MHAPAQHAAGQPVARARRGAGLEIAVRRAHLGDLGAVGEAVGKVVEPAALAHAGTLMLTILSLSTPAGTLTSTVSPFLRPISARPTGDSFERRPGRRVGLGRADDAVRRVALAVEVLDRDLQPDVDGAGVRLGRIDDARRAQALLELRDLLLEHHLLVLRVVELGVLADVAELARDADAVGDLAPLVGRQVLQLLLQLLVALLSEQDVSLHDASIGPGGQAAAGKTSSGRTKHMRARRRPDCSVHWVAPCSQPLSPPARLELASPFQIGEVEIASRVVLAPMAGVSVQAFRRQGRRFGAGLVCSEMVSACGLSHGNARTLGYLRIARDEHPLAVQVFGSEPATVAEAARMCEAAGADIIDINFGCPVRKVTKTGAGASALDNHDVAVAVTRAVADAVAVPVTVKLRAGVRNGSRDCLVLGPKLVDAGAQAITLHPRSAQQMYTGRADHALTAELVELVDVPVMASGDITTRAARPGSARARPAPSAVMIARGAQGDPWLLAELVDGVRREPSDEELVGELVRFVREVAREMTPERAVGWLRKFYGWYLRGGRLGPGMRAALAQAKTIDEVERLLLEACPGGTAAGRAERPRDRRARRRSRTTSCSTCRSRSTRPADASRRLSAAARRRAGAPRA